MNRLKNRKQRELSPLVTRFLIALNMRLQWLNVYLQGKAARFSPAHKKAFLALFCLVFASGSTVVIFNGFSRNARWIYPKGQLWKVPSVPGPSFNPVITLREYEKIEGFRDYLATHKSFRDSLLLARPHLTDTLDYLHKLYKQDEDGK